MFNLEKRAPGLIWLEHVRFFWKRPPGPKCTAGVCPSFFQSSPFWGGSDCFLLTCSVNPMTLQTDRNGAPEVEVDVCEMARYSALLRFLLFTLSFRGNQNCFESSP